MVADNNMIDESQTVAASSSSTDEIDLRELFAVIWQGKWLIMAITALFSIASVIYVLTLPNIYKSEALLAPATEQKANGLSGQLGGLAALAGVNLGGGAAVDKTALAIEIVKSREFLGRFIEKRIQLADLMAIENWDLSTNTVQYNSDIYDVTNQQWLREVEPPRQAKPSVQEAYKELLKILVVNQDQATSMVKLSIQHVSPYIAQSWVKILVEDLNLEMKTRDIEEAEKSISYLQQQIPKTEVADLRTALYSLVEEQTKTLMLANVREEYALKTIDKPIVPEEKAGPARALICLVITFLGGFIGMIVVLSRAFLSNKE